MKEFETLLDDMNAELSELQKKNQEKSQKIFQEMFKTFFDSNPEIKAIGWRQYTPYFNDGDECVFRCNVDYAWATNTENASNISYGEYDGDDGDSVWIYDPDYGDFNDEIIPKSVRTNMTSFRKILAKISDDTYKAMFGDHVTVIATRDGFETEYYEHD